MTTVARLMLLDAVAHPLREFARRELGGVDLLDDAACRCLTAPARSMPSPLARSNSSPSSSSKMNSAAFSPRSIACDRERSESAATCRCRPARGPACSSRARSRRRARASSSAECALAAVSRLNLRLVLGRDQPRENLHAAGLDDQVVIAAAEVLAAIFDDPQPPPLGAIFGRQFLQPEHAVRDAVHGLVVGVGGEIVEHQHGGAVCARNNASAPGPGAGSAASFARAGGSRTGCRARSAAAWLRSIASKMRLVVSPSSRSDE